MDNRNFIKLLKTAGNFDLNTSKRIDRAIIHDIRHTGINEIDVSEQKRVFNGIFFRVIMVMTGLFLLIFALLPIYNSGKNCVNPQDLYNNVISQIKDINSSKDITKAMEIYSEDFFKHNNKQELKKNIEILFKNYTVVKYEPVKGKIIIKNNNALIENNIRYHAQAGNKAVKPLFYAGKEKIYLKKNNEQWKIVAWLFENN